MNRIRTLAWIIIGVAACSEHRTIADDDVDSKIANPVSLTAKNIAGRCNVTIDNGEIVYPQQTIAGYAPGQTVSLTATAVSGYTLGLWHHTANDTGSGDPLSSTSVTLGDSPACVWICCSAAPGDCPTTDQCQ